MEVEQPALPGLAPRRRPVRSAAPVADSTPIARVVVDLPQPHLDREFDYLVPATMAQDVRPGVRVKVRFAGRDVDGWVVDRVAESEHVGALTPVRRLVSAEVVLGPQVLTLARAVARRWAGTLPDVLRLAVPPRHARVEEEDWGAAGVVDAAQADAARAETARAETARAETAQEAPSPAWWAHTGGAAFLRRVASGDNPRAVWQALPGAVRWTEQIAEAVLAARHGGRGALVVVPSGREVDEMLAALVAAGVEPWAPGRTHGWVRLVAEDGPAARYRAFLAASRGVADVVVGTRAGAFAPVQNLGLVVCWDDGDPLHAEPRAPYPNARDVLALRADAGAALLVGGYVRSVATQRWVTEGWAHAVVADRAQVRAVAPRVVHLDRTELASDGPAAAARLPSAAWRAVRDGLAAGPVLIQVPRAGYLPGVACARCRTAARCAVCAGPLRLASAQAAAACGWCGAPPGPGRGPGGGPGGLLAPAGGAARTAEELGRAFPGATLRRSSAAHGVLARVPARPALVVATTGAEPVAEGGYRTVVLLDAAVTAARPGLDAEQDALRHWFAAAALARPASDGGLVLLVGEVPTALAGALVRWDPAGFAARLLAERAELGLPPAAHLVTVEGERAAVEDVVRALRAPTTVRGPVPTGPPPDGVLDPERSRPVRALLQTPWAGAPALVDDLAAVLATRSAHREAAVRVRVEPDDVGA